MNNDPKKPLGSKLKQPHGNDKLVFIKTFAFGNEKPIQSVIASVTEIVAFPIFGEGYSYFPYLSVKNKDQMHQL